MDATSFVQKRAQLRKFERLLHGKQQNASQPATSDNTAVRSRATTTAAVPILDLPRSLQHPTVEPVPLTPTGALIERRTEAESGGREYSADRGRATSDEMKEGFRSVAEVRLAYKRRIREMEATQKRMHLTKVRHASKRQHPSDRHRPSKDQPPQSDDLAAEAEADEAEASERVVVLDELSFRKFTVDLEYRSAISRQCRTALLSNKTVVLRAPLHANDHDLRECRMVLQSLYMQVSALTRADVFPEAVTHTNEACATMTLEPKR